LALGAHDRAASRVAAKAAVSVAMNEAEMKPKQRIVQIGRSSEHSKAHAAKWTQHVLEIQL